MVYEINLNHSYDCTMACLEKVRFMHLCSILYDDLASKDLKILLMMIMGNGLKEQGLYIKMTEVGKS